MSARPTHSPYGHSPGARRCDFSPVPSSTRASRVFFMRRASAGAQSKQVNASTRRQHVSVECYLITAYDHPDLTSYIREAHWFWRKIAGSLAFGTTPLREHPSMADNTRSQGQGNQGNQGMPGGQQQH